MNHPPSDKTHSKNEPGDHQSGPHEFGMVEEVLPQGLFKIKLESGQTINASLSLSFKRVNIHVVPGMQVVVERYAMNPARGKIIDTHK